MPLRNILFVFAAGLGWFARGATLGSSHATASAAVVHPIEVRYPTIAIVAAVADDSEPAASADSDTPEDENAGDDIGDLLAKAKLATATHNGVRGHVVDRDTGAPVRNVVVLANRDDDHERTNTNADGDYEIDDLEAGTYVVSFVYGSVYTTHENITVGSFDLSTVDERLDTAAAEREDYSGEEEMFEQQPDDRPSEETVE